MSLRHFVEIDALDPATLRQLLDVARHLKAGKALPGHPDQPLRGKTLTRSVQVYSLWMLQRVLDPYRALPDPERARVNDALAGTGWEAVLAYTPRHVLEKRGYDLVFAEPSR